MEIPEQLRCLFTAQVTEQDGAYHVELPKREVELGEFSENETYRVAVFETEGDSGEGAGTTEQTDRSEADYSLPGPPVEEGETRTVEIESLGDQGDGIARVDRGFVVIVPDTEQGERVRIEIEDVSQNVAFGAVVERLSYYE